MDIYVVYNFSLIKMNADINISVCLLMQMCAFLCDIAPQIFRLKDVHIIYFLDIAKLHQFAFCHEYESSFLCNLDKI